MVLQCACYVFSNMKREDGSVLDYFGLDPVPSSSAGNACSRRTSLPRVKLLALDYVHGSRSKDFVNATPFSNSNEWMRRRI